MKSHVWHLTVIKTKKRDKLQLYLTANGIQTLIHYPIPSHKQKAYVSDMDLKYLVNEQIHEELLSLPISSVISLTETEHVSSVINSF